VDALLIDPDVARLSPSLLAQRLRAQGFDQLEHAEVIPGITRTITAVKRAGLSRPAFQHEAIRGSCRYDEPDRPCVFSS
jgi:hypothetical protein